MTSIIKVNNLQNQCGANIISESSNTITIGASGDTVVLAAGASQSGFGRSGSVNWDTTPKTTGFTAVSGNGYFCNTTSAAFTVTLPAGPSAGDIVSIADYNGTAATNNITIGRNSSNINGSAADFIISKNYAAISFVYVDATAGWRSVDTSNITDVQNPFVLATGGTITTCGDYKIHTFTGPGTFTVTSAGNASGSNSVDYLVVAGGGGGGTEGGGGGGGGYRQNYPSPTTAGLPVTAQAYPITVGGGGAIAPAPGDAAAGSGSNSVFSTITSAGGGGGGSKSPTGPNPVRGGVSGGSGGGASRDAGSGLPGGAGNTPPTSPPQGNAGGNSPATGGSNGGGGGGASAVGQTVSPPGGAGGNGGAGSSNLISGSSVAYAGGGGGGVCSCSPVAGTGGTGGGGAGGKTGAGTPGSVNTGGGGGGGGFCAGKKVGGTGGSGIVVIRYKFQ